MVGITCLTELSTIRPCVDPWFCVGIQDHTKKDGVGLYAALGEET